MVPGTAQHAIRDGGPASADGCGALLSATEQEFLTLLTELSVDFAPRRFALCEIDGTPQDWSVFGWGMAFDNRALFCAADGHVVGTFPSAERALAVLSHCADLHLVWVDDDRADGETG